ncbi:glycosyltransferase family 39 protein [Streptomyces sp. NPDC088354]|uniref:glycosyltransferase family 39 protein n=1 Tax=Streptomyces sp. NPDC088354 TaxID=3365856 RepID=UPI003807402F
MTVTEPTHGPAPVAADEEPVSRRRGRSNGGAGRVATALLFLVPAALTLASSLNGIGDRQMWRDEHATWWAATLSLGDLSQLIRNIDVVFAPYYFLMHLWVSSAGDSPTALRVPAAFAMAAAAGLLALVGRRMFTTGTGLLAGLVFAAVPSVTEYGQQARPYAFAVAFTLLSTLVLLRALDRPSLKGWTLYAATIPLIGFSHLVSLSVLAGHLGMVVMARRKGDRIAHWAFAAAALTGLSVVLPMLAQGSNQSGQIAWNNPTFQDLVNHPQKLFGSWVTGGAVMALGVVGLLVVRKYAVLLAPWVVLPPVVTYLTAAQLHLFLPRYLLFTVPAWVLLASAAVTRLSGPLTDAVRTGTARRVFGGVLVAVAAAVFAWQAQPGLALARQNDPAEPDYRGAHRLVAQGFERGDGIAFSGQKSERRAMAFEFRHAGAADRPKDVLMWRTPQQMGNFGALECPDPAKCLAKTDRLWVVSTSALGTPFADMPQKTAVVLSTRFKVAKTSSLPNVRVLLLKRVR